MKTIGIKALGTLAIAVIAGASLAGCTAEEPAPSAQPAEAEQSQPAQPVEQPDEEVLYGVTMPTIKDSMSPSEKASTEQMRLLKLEADREGNAPYRLGKIFTTSDHSGVMLPYDPEDHFEKIFKTVEGQCLAESLDDAGLTDYENAIRVGIDTMVENDGNAVSGYEFRLFMAYLELDNSEALAKTDALYRQIEGTGCLDEDSRSRPEMVDGWNL